MAHLRTALIKADESGDIGRVEAAAKNLQHYVATHMNADTGRVALQTSHNEAAEAALAQAKPPEIDENIYQRASESCRIELTNYGYRAWANCVASTVGTNGTLNLAVFDDVAPDPDLFYVDYASPRWSLDLAGVSLLGAVVSGAILTLHGIKRGCAWAQSRLKSLR